MKMFNKKSVLVDAANALPGRDTPQRLSGKHYVTGNSIQAPFPEPLETAIFGMGCFWGAEKLFWQLPGVYSTAVGYSAGYTPHPTYQEVCSGQTAHNEVVLVVFYPEEITYNTLLTCFWEGHNPTQGMQQGNDRGTQYRSGIYTNDTNQSLAESSRERYQQALNTAGFGKITTEIIPASSFYYAEEYHQQYLAKNPTGYCGLGGTQVNMV